MFFLSGCGAENELGRKAVSGTVTLDGQPLDYGNISFEPLDPSGTSAGSAIEAGQYTIAEDRGLPTGSYRVRIYAPAGQAAPTEAPGESVLQKERIPSNWNTNSQEQIEVTADGENVFNFDIKTSG